MLAYALEYAADGIARLARGRQAGPSCAKSETAGEQEQPQKHAQAQVSHDEDVVMKTEEDVDAAPPPPPPPPAQSPPDVSSTATGDGAPDVPAVPGDSSQAQDGDGEEDPDMRKLRMNLLALAKRAPLDQIMKLPAELVPAHLRHIVPTLDA